MALRTTEVTKGVGSSWHERITEERRLALPDPSRVSLYRDYARGAHKQTFTPAQMKFLKGMRLLIVHNVIKRILTVLADRIHVTGYQVSDDSVSAYLTDLWVRNWLSALYAQIVYTTLRDGNAGASLSYNNASRRVVVTREKWFNGSSGIWFSYDDTGEQLYAVKDWKTPEGDRRTLYLPGEIRRFILDRGGWRWYTDAANPKTGPIPFVDKEDQPLGIPAVHFAIITTPADSDEENRDNFRDGNYGDSRVEPLLGLQDSQNELLRLKLVAARFTAYQIVTASGLKQKKDEATGLEIPPSIFPGGMLSSEDPAARFGHIPAGSIEQLLKAEQSLLDAMAQVAVVPEHSIKGVWPSGEALMRAEMPLIDQAKKAAASLGPAFASVAHKALKLENKYGAKAYDTSRHIVTLFEPPERYDPMTLTNLATARAPYVSLAEVWRLMGYDLAKQNKIKSEMQEEASFRPEASLGASSGQEDDDPEAAKGALFSQADSDE